MNLQGEMGMGMIDLLYVDTLRMRVCRPHARLALCLCNPDTRAGGAQGETGGGGEPAVARYPTFGRSPRPVREQPRVQRYPASVRCSRTGRGEGAICRAISKCKALPRPAKHPNRRPA